MIKKGNRKFYICKWECGLYSIERITKGFGGSVIFKETIEEIERYQRNYKSFYSGKDYFQVCYYPNSQTA